MRKNHFNILLQVISMLVLLPSCKKDYNNPNAATQEETFASDRAATAVAAGLQRVYSTSAAGSLYALVDANGFVTNELVLRNAGNTGELQLSTGGSAVDGTNSVLINVWTKSNKIIFDANNVLGFANKLADKSYSSGLISYVAIFKALSIGNMSMFWEKVPDTIGLNVPFIDRVEGFKKALAVINMGIDAFRANTPSTLFYSRIPADIDLLNSLYALKARYSLFAGDYAGALA